MSLLTVQLVCAFGALLVLVLCGLIPLALLNTGARQSHVKDLVLSLLNCFACGVFLSTCFLGLVPHVRMQEMHLNEWIKNSTAPNSYLWWNSVESWTDLTLLLGFLLVLIAEQLMTFCSGGGGHGHSHGPTPVAKVSSTSRLLTEEEEGDSDLDDLAIRPPLVDAAHPNKPPTLSFQSIALLLGLGVHTIFEGVALGLQTSTVTFVHLFIGVMLHEVLCAFAFGTSLAKDGARFSHTLLYVILLAVMIPAGMLIAMVVPQSRSFGTLMCRLVLEGLAAGTFVYVACVEMLPAELDGGGGHAHSPHDHVPGHAHPPSKNALLKCVAVIMGFVCFFFLTSLNGG